VLPVARDLTAGRTSVADAAIELSLVGHHRPGIERQVIAILGRLNIGIQALDTQLSAEPHSGAALIQIEARVRLPAGLQPAEVQAVLEDVSPDVMVDIPLSPARR
jgi:glycine cleavage system regulatory protein